MEQAADFVAESNALSAVLVGLDADDWDRPTQFKNWTINDIIVHLHFWNRAADLALNEPGKFAEKLQTIPEPGKGSGLRDFEQAEITERGAELLAVWRELFLDMGNRWSELDPRKRVSWAGPDMSVRSSMTARQMETWAHGQAIFDLLGIERLEQDRIRNIVVLGVNALGWSFKVHGRDVPDELPFLKLTAPSGAVWTFGETGQTDRITGSAVEFAQVVTQTRNVADTGLLVEGPVASQWMADAQCFAGPPETPPAPGTRFTRGK
ncbi:MAG: TIGR03084 family metal-binding protein [Alphaproteobacteria bacterium]|nr:TIGR03084 family metal-binding protein [Alphaproteobacteria bacterium]